MKWKVYVKPLKTVKLLHIDLNSKETFNEQFSNKYTLIPCHMRKLLSLKNVYDSTDIKSLNNLFDAIETQVCSFNDLDYILANKTRRPYRFFF